MEVPEEKKPLEGRTRRSALMGAQRKDDIGFEAGYGSHVMCTGARHGGACRERERRRGDGDMYGAARERQWLGTFWRDLKGLVV